MVKLEETDLRILAVLDLDARMNDTQIAKKLDLSAPTVHKHIKEFESRQIIKGFFSRIDYLRLGYISYRVYLKLNANREAEKIMMDHLKNSPYTRWCGYASGKYDLAAIFFSKSNEQFCAFWNGFKMKFKSYVREAALVPYFGDVMSGLPYTKEMKMDRNISQIGGNGNVGIDGTDRKILGMLARDARASLSDVGRNTDLTPGAVKYRIDNLTERKVLTGFRAFVDLSKLGYTCYKVDLNLDSSMKMDELEKHLLSRANVSNIIRTASWADIETCMCVKSPKELHATLRELKDGFPCIGNYDIFEIPDEVKTVYMPDF